MVDMHYVRQGTKKKDIDGPSGELRKRVRPAAYIPRAAIAPEGQTHRYRSRWVVEEGKKWYRKHIESKYDLEGFID